MKLDPLPQGNPESVTLQSREDVLGMMPLHVACENGELEVVEVGPTKHKPCRDIPIWHSVDMWYKFCPCSSL